MRFSVAGVEGDRPLEAGGSVLEPTLCTEHDAEVIAYLGTVRLEVHRPLDELDGVLPPQLMRHDATEMKAADVIGRKHIDLPIHALGVGKPSGLMVPHRRGKLLGNTGDRFVAAGVSSTCHARLRQLAMIVGRRSV